MRTGLTDNVLCQASAAVLSFWMLPGTSTILDEYRGVLQSLPFEKL